MYFMVIETTDKKRIIVSAWEGAVSASFTLTPKQADLLIDDIQKAKEEIARAAADVEAKPAQPIEWAGVSLGGEMAKKTKATDTCGSHEPVVESKEEQVVVAYKGFGPDWKCRDFQYEVGKTYTHDGNVKACESGFHACEYPLDVLGYYDPASSKFAIVEQTGVFSRHSDDSKVASSSITVKSSIDLPGLIKAAVEYTFSRVKPIDPNSPASNSGERGAASNSGRTGIAADFSGFGKAKSCESGAIVCVSRDDDGNILHIRASKVGENGIKPDVWYALDADGQFIETTGE